MLISHKFGLIFLKTIKTGGSSVEMALERLIFADRPRQEPGKPFESEDGIIGARGSDVAGEKYWHHMPVVQVYKQLGYEKFNDYRKITIVRNPFDKVVSWFFFGFHKQTDFVSDREAFNSFIQTSQKLPVDRAIYCISGIICCNKILRYESLAEDYRNVVKNYLSGVNDAESLPREKTKTRAVRVPFSEYYDQKSKDIVERAFQFELSNFNYSFATEE